MSINVQQDATTHSLFYLQIALQCFGWSLHPSSGAQIAVSTASGTSQPLLLPVAIVAELRLVRLMFIGPCIIAIVEE